VLLDLGVSSLQLDEQERGFAYRHDAPLDMRMDQDSGITAAQVLNTYAQGDLEHILRTYGEERFAKRVASAIVRERAREPFIGSARLVELLRSVIPAASQKSGGHPAKRTFQALRIEVNGELEALAAALPEAVEALAAGGRIAVLSYHSLEDRLAKQALAAGAHSGTPVGLPVELPDLAPYLRLLTRGAEEPSAAEISENPRAASARLRAAERTRVTKGHLA
jgi:16S rRNA (cytosine1402-N4)-methyltransferase